MKSYLCGAIGAFASCLSYALGGWDDAIVTLLFVIIIDYFTGLVVAAVFKASNKSKSGGLDSQASYKGLVKKVMILVFVAIAYRLDIQLGTTYIRDGVCVAFIANEVISIIENAGLMGLPIPEVLRNAIDVLKGGDTDESK